MSTVIHFGNLLVPVVAEYTSPNRPSYYPDSEVYNVISPAENFFDMGVSAGYDSATNTGTFVSQGYLDQGTTDMHSGMALVVDAKQPYGNYSAIDGWHNIIHVKKDGVDLETADFVTANGWNAAPAYDLYEEFFNLIAVRYKTTPDYGNGYFITIVRKVRTFDGSIEAASYDFGNAVFINIPVYNEAGYNVSLDEETPSEDPFDPSEDDPYPDSPPPPDSSDLISIPNNPTIGVTNSGFINIYNPGLGSLQGLGDIIFPNVASATDVLDALLKLCETLANQNLINYVIDCHVIPVSPTTGPSSNIKVGFRDTGISVPVVVSDYVDVSCGSLTIPEFFHGFQDYMGTRSKIYLPFIGFVDTKPEYWQAGTISIDYKFNVIDGSFMAYIRSVSSKSNLNGSVIAQYAGNACMHFPLTGVNYSNMVSGLVGAAISASSGGTASAVLGSALSAANTIAQGGNVQQSNGYNSTAALLGVRTPFLLIERAVPSYPSNYAHNKGYPSNITTALSDVAGYTEIEDIDLSGIPLTQTEIEELRTLLKEGVYF